LPDELALLTRLQRLILSDNLLQGKLQQSLLWTDLTELNLSNNQLVGPLPKDWSYMTNLQLLDVGHNELSSTLPPEFGSLTNLVLFGVNHNLLTGTVPSDYSTWKSIQTWRLEYNNLIGFLVPDICDLTQSWPPGTLTADCEEMGCKCCTHCCNETKGCSFVGYDDNNGFGLGSNDGAYDGDVIDGDGPPP